MVCHAEQSHCNFSDETPRNGNGHKERNASQRVRKTAKASVYEQIEIEEGVTNEITAMLDDISLVSAMCKITNGSFGKQLCVNT